MAAEQSAHETTRRQLDISKAEVEAMAAVIERAGVSSATLYRRYSNKEALVEAALARIRRSCGQLRVDSLSAELGVSRQHLTRKFDAQVGLSTKMFSRVWRLQTAVERIRHVEAIDWSDLALDSGYYDQAHMIGEFRELTGKTPAVLSNEL